MKPNTRLLRTRRTAKLSIAQGFFFLLLEKPLSYVSKTDLVKHLMNLNSFVKCICNRCE